MAEVECVVWQVSAVVRLNSREYDRQEFVRCGFNHYDLFFEVPPPLRTTLSAQLRLLPSRGKISVGFQFSFLAFPRFSGLVLNAAGASPPGARG